MGVQHGEWYRWGYRQKASDETNCIEKGALRSWFDDLVEGGWL